MTPKGERSDTNEAAERLLSAIYQATPAGSTHSQKYTIWQKRLDAALAAERRATVERIRERLNDEVELWQADSRRAYWPRLSAILDEEAAR